MVRSIFGRKRTRAGVRSLALLCAPACVPPIDEGQYHNSPRRVEFVYYDGVGPPLVLHRSSYAPPTTSRIEIAMISLIVHRSGHAGITATLENIGEFAKDERGSPFVLVKERAYWRIMGAGTDGKLHTSDDEWATLILQQ